MREIRIRFAKTDRAKYISHLDINRAFSRAIARAKINLWYTEGFNPRPFMSFSLPLSLGVESLCESVDIRILDDITNEEVKNSDYVFKIEFADNQAALEKINAVLASDEILALKKAKKGKRRILKESNIKEFIVKYNTSIRGNNVIINTRLCAGPDRNLNPILLFDTILRLIDMDYEWKSISRISLLTKDFKEYK